MTESQPVGVRANPTDLHGQGCPASTRLMECIALDLQKFFGRKKPRKTGASRKTAAARKQKAAASRRLAWVLGATAVVVVLGVGLLNWTKTGQGQATLLTLGSDKMYGEVQTAVDTALAKALPGFTPGPVTNPTDHDWPAPEFGPGAMIHCRSLSLETDDSWWEVQAQVATAVEQVGARILWGERLLPARLGPEQRQPNEERDLLRLDIGVAGRPTHTLVLSRASVRTRLQWGGGPGVSRWTEFAGGQAPVVALIIDDWGNGKTGSAMEILSAPASLTLAVLPNLPYSRFFSLQRTELVLPPGRLSEPEGTNTVAGLKVASGRTARLQAGCPVEVSTGRRRSAWPQKRREVILHLPMEPQGYPETNPGPAALLVGMNETEVRTRLDDALAALINVTGVNNHMGSAATSDTPLMRTLMSVLQEKDLFFVDSLTSANSVAYAEAQRAGIPAARNRIFLDYDNENESAITANLHRLVQSARSSGFAVGIGHPHRATAAVLTRELPGLIKEGVRFVTISELMALQEYQASILAEAGDS
ncbi:MAG: divergent polysaccharide deacetylase family protein [Candidatus Krumholzibacteria bacterium]|nr:divergent polysaccharide deacetylase family protein [Candidatus Krumholzibacteria bacterium]